MPLTCLRWQHIPTRAQQQNLSSTSFRYVQNDGFKPTSLHTMLTHGAAGFSARGHVPATCLQGRLTARGATFGEGGWKMLDVRGKHKLELSMRDTVISVRWVQSMG